MFNKYRVSQQQTYQTARSNMMNNPNKLILLEKFFSGIITKIVQNNIEEMCRDYNEASYLYPFWENYPPEERGNHPVGDQYPWIEVGEHAVGSKLPRLISQEIDEVRDTGLPTGSDQRFILKDKRILNIMEFTDSAWLFVDIKSVGPRDNFDHTVLSPNQVSGDGNWYEASKGVENTILKARGKRASHDFHCSIPPLYVLSDNTIAPVVILFVKIAYEMNSLVDKEGDPGQPLSEITVITIPNGLLLTHGPNYLKTHPGLLFPGKDDKKKDPRKLRARISFPILKAISDWRIQSINIPSY